MIEAAAEGDEALLNKYLEGGELDDAEIKRGLRARAIKNEICLVTCGSAFKNKGVQALLDAVVEYMPSPTEVPPVKGQSERGEPMTRQRRRRGAVRGAGLQDPERPVRRQSDLLPGLFRHAEFGRQVYVPNKNRNERIGRAAADARQRALRDQGSARRRHRRGRGPEGRHHRRHAVRPEKVIILEKMEFPEPVISVAVEPKTKVDQEKMGVALQRLAKEDPSFRVHTDQESGQTIISGMGELHLEIIVDRMKREFKVDANVGKPQVAYRETIRATRRVGRQVRAPVRRPRPVRPRVAEDRAAAGRARATNSSTASSAARCRASSFPPWTRASRRRCRPA